MVWKIITKTRAVTEAKRKSQKNIFIFLHEKKNDIRCPPLLMRSHISNSFMYCTYCSVVCNISFCTKYLLYKESSISNVDSSIYSKLYSKNERIFSRARPFLKRVNSLETSFGMGDLYFCYTLAARYVCLYDFIFVLCMWRYCVFHGLL